MQMIELFKDWEDQVEYAKGEVIFREGDVADVMYVLTRGEVETSLRGEPLGAELPGGIIGEMALINAKFRSATATAIRPSSLARIGTGEALRALRDRYASADVKERRTLLGQVSRIASPQARAVLEQGLSDPDAGVAAAAARALVNAGGPRVHERIEMLLHSNRAEVRKAAGWAVRFRRSPLYWRHKSLVDRIFQES